MNRSSEWTVGMLSNVHGRECKIVRFNKNLDRTLVRWLVDYDEKLAGNVGKNKTQWVDRDKVAPRYAERF